MKLAYLITAYNNPNHLNKLIRAINTSDCDIFVHIDKKSTIKFKVSKSNNVFIPSNNVKVYWGSFTFIKAVLLLIEKAIQTNNYDYFILLSGTCYPVKSNKYIKNFIQKNKNNEYINLVEMPENGKSLDRVDYFYYSEYEKKLTISNIAKRLFNFTVKKLHLKRKFPNKYKKFKLYGGSTWWAMSNACVKYIMTFAQNNPEYLKFYNNTLIPEEMFFQTIVGNSKFKKKVKNNFTYTDWPADNLAHPEEISLKHISILSKKNNITNRGVYQDILFARKFSDNSEKVINVIEKKLRK